MRAGPARCSHSTDCLISRVRVAQLEARVPHKDEAEGSNPSPDISILQELRLYFPTSYVTIPPESHCLVVMRCPG